MKYTRNEIGPSTQANYHKRNGQLQLEMINTRPFLIKRERRNRSVRRRSLDLLGLGADPGRRVHVDTVLS